MTQTNSNSAVDDYTKYILLDYRQKLLRILLITCIIILLGLTIFSLIDRGRTTLIDWDGFDLVSAGIAIRAIRQTLRSANCGYVHPVDRETKMKPNAIDLLIYETFTRIFCL